MEAQAEGLAEGLADVTLAVPEPSGCELARCVGISDPEEDRNGR